MSSFATAEDLAVYLFGDDVPDDLWAAQATLLLELISGDIASASGNKIAAGTGTHLLPGVWSRDLILPQRPVTSITSVYLNGTLVAAGEYEWNDRQLLRRGVSELGSDDLEFDSDRQGAGPAPEGLSWGGPASTVRVTYGWGGEIPTVAKSLALRVASRVIENPSGVSSEQLGAYSVQYGRTVGAGGTHLTPTEERMLRKRFGRTAGTIATGADA